MPTLLIRLCGPMQSWGTRSRWSERDTELEPSLSGVVGLLCAAAGVQREQPIPLEWLALQMGVRIDREGTLARDYHTAGGVYPSGVARADGGKLFNAVLSNRYYLADADFLVGLQHDDRAVLEKIEQSLRAPRWQLFLGRKSFLPDVPVYLPPGTGGGLRDLSLQPALELGPWLEQPARRGHQRPVRFVIQCEPGANAEVRMDQPTADSFRTRRFQQRYVRSCFQQLGSTSDA